MFLTNRLSGEGVGLTCGVGDGEGCAAGWLCADMLAEAKTIKVKTNATRRAFGTAVMLLPI
jgi:hypothetical protein